jgi:putative NIF3 family GTP cyclohydrolase 1 type 2
MRIQQVVDQIIETILRDPFEETVDTFKCGDPDWEVTGIACTFLCTLSVMKQAVERGCNFVISHEPVFYNHLDKSDGLEDDPVYLQKRAYAEEHDLAVWRFHDYAHTHDPDLIYVGIEQRLGWSDFRATGDEPLYIVPETTQEALEDMLGERLGCDSIRSIGRGDRKIERIALAVGASGYEHHLHLLRALKPDILICGEVNEWETPEYVRDAMTLGANTGLIVTGHAPSEEAGMEYVVEWLKKLVADQQVVFIPSGDPFGGPYRL